MIARLAHICLEVRDMNRTVAFYRDGLGFPVAFRFMKEGRFAGAYFAIGDRSFIEAFEVERPAGTPHFCLETDDIDGFIAAAAARGIACTPRKLGGCRTWQTWLRDPDGHAIEVQEYTGRSMQFNGGTCEITWR
jgi:catechol 2,3-dioxygenase-like lactoylglutathione lyase family enzyme